MSEIREPRKGCPPASIRNRAGRAAALVGLVSLCALAVCASALQAQVRATYLYSLADFSGPLRYDWAHVRVDQERDEVYLVYQDLVRIFNQSGMEVFSFGDDLGLGHILDVAVDGAGDIILLSYKDARSVVTRCTFRGEPIGPVEIKGLPAGLAFNANRMVYRNGQFYFATLAASSLIITDNSGGFLKHVDFGSLLDAVDQKKGGGETVGFAVDPDGNIFFTVPTMFKVFKYSPDGKLASFGRPGSAVGRFGILAGVAVDSRGNVLVADKLKCVVMAFDKGFNFLGEFGYRGPKPENLILPDDVAVDRKDRLYVSHARRRGVSVFSLTGD